MKNAKEGSAKQRYKNKQTVKEAKWEEGGGLVTKDEWKAWENGKEVGTKRCVER